MEFNSGIDAEGRFGEVYLDGHKHIPTPRRSLPAATAEEATVTKDRAKEIVESTEVREQVADLNTVAPVVALPSLRVGQDLIGLRYFTEARFGRRIVRIGIRMGIAGKFAERPLDLVTVGITRYTEYLVVVGHRQDPRLSARLSLTSSTIEIVLL